MEFSNIQSIVSEERLQRFLDACSGNPIRAIEIYRANVRVSLEMFAIVGAFEIALRNAIDRVMTASYGKNWLRDAVHPGGFFDIPQCHEHAKIIRFAYYKLLNRNDYSHSHLLTKMEFGIWKYMFSNPQFRASGRILLNVFPNKPISTRFKQYNNTTIFNELDHVNSLRNRIAHHEPICFPTGKAEITMDYIKWIYNKIILLFDWMDIDSNSYLEGFHKLSVYVEKLEKL